jgi:Ca2+-binding EF-hand superfamily protein
MTVNRQPTITGPSPKARKAAPKMSDAERKMANDFFRAYDYDGGGTIDFQELTELLTDLNLPMDTSMVKEYIVQDDESDDLRMMFMGLAESGDPSKMKINFDQFCHIYISIMSCQPPAVRALNMGKRVSVLDLNESEVNLRAAFATFDADGSGFLDAEELKGLFRELGLPDHDGDDYLRVVEQGFKDQKKDLSEAISYQEFVLYRNMIVHGIEEESPSALDVY